MNVEDSRDHIFTTWIKHFGIDSLVQSAAHRETETWTQATLITQSSHHQNVAAQQSHSNRVAVA